MASSNPTPGRQSLVKEFDQLIENAKQEGVVDDNFKSTHDLKECTGPFFFFEVVSNFINDSHTTLKEMTMLLNEDKVNYKKLEQLCIKMKGGTSCLGACSVAKACAELRNAAEKSSHEGCIVKLNILEDEFVKLENNLDNILELERKIITSMDP